MSSLHWLILVLVLIVLAFVLAPVILRSIQNRDFKRQVSGKQPLRQAREGDSLPTEHVADANLEQLRMEARSRSIQNLIGPK